MSDQESKELDAFFAFFATFDLARPVATVADLSDGAALFEILSLVDADYFRQSTRTNTAQISDNWVLRFSTLKRLYRLLTQYFTDVLQKPTSGLEVPDLQAIAKDYNVGATLVLCRMTIAIAVQSEKNKDIIEKIQKLNESAQHQLMKSIEQVMVKINASHSDNGIGHVMTEDDHYYQIQSERSHVLAEKETIEKVYQVLLEDHRVLQTNYDDVVSEKDDTLARLRDMQRDLENRRHDKPTEASSNALGDASQKSEDNLAMTEAELDKQTGLVGELTRKVDELQVTADLAARLKDQVDEYRHAADKLQKTENVMEKYKKKLQEGADLRQHVKSLERQNADLVDKNASLEEEYRKVAAFKPLMDSYKNQIAELETKVASRTHEIETNSFALNNELDNALSGTTMTDLKLQIKKLERELSAVKKNEADGSRILVLENLLEDANRTKSRYEADYLAAHREKLVLQRDLEEIRSGKALGDGAEAAIALRQRLNETVDQLDALRKEHADLEVQFDTQKRELTIAKSDLNLINKDQVDILASLRESVNEDKALLEAETERLKKQIKELNEKNRMQLEQVNALLLEKVNLQSEGIGQREMMLQRERAIGDLRASLSGKDVPEDIKARLLALHEENLNVKEQLKTTQDKLAKAKTFIKSQDKLFKEEQAKLASTTAQNISEETQGSLQTQIEKLQDDLTRANTRYLDLEKRYQFEFYHMSGVIHHTGMLRLWSSYAQPTSKEKPEPSAWLGQQRKNLGHVLHR
ncbi:HOOK-domain-containing protein [Boletus edulis]|nr:HOOK-domain-containing protein [Boletus edulis]